jgi:predicted dehydrogenase
VVNLVFRNGATAAMTMTAFGGGGRKTRIFGTQGEIYGNSEQITVYDFLTDKSETIEVNKEDNTILGGHGGGDFGLMNSFIEAVAKHDRSLILSGAEETLESHMIVFAAEQARLTGKVVKIPEFIARYGK